MAGVLQVEVNIVTANQMMMKQIQAMNTQRHQWQWLGNHPLHRDKWQRPGDHPLQRNKWHTKVLLLRENN